jgi:hypothetical protein
MPLLVYDEVPLKFWSRPHRNKEKVALPMIVPTSAEFPQVCMMRGSRIFSTPKTHPSADKVHLILPGKCIIEHQSQIPNAFAVWNLLA